MSTVPRRTAFWTTLVVLMVHSPTAAVAAGRTDSACMRLSPGDRLLALVPYLWLIVVIGVLIGLVVGWLSRRAGDNSWESARQGMATGLTITGPLLSVLTLLAVLPPAC
ncbi:hypothetical protein ABZ930_16840 [Streptomyces sp. NPDC046716]|uniref:hypothetical protein n=1 Tax=Streptomyces sp. NPDC046716 TaxID=3157093 RepID=UPI0033F56952